MGFTNISTMNTPRKYLPLSGFPPALDVEQRAELKAAVQELPSQAGVDLSNWNWKSVRQFVADRFGLALSRSPPVADLNYPVSSTGQALHRLGFVLKRPKKRLVKADLVRREAFVAEYAALTVAARRTGVKIFFADEAHFQADADLRGKWVLKGEPALVDSTSPRRGEKASYYSAVCLETGGGGGDGTGGQQQLGYLSRLPETPAGPAHRTTDGDLGQFASPPGRRAAGRI